MQHVDVFTDTVYFIPVGPYVATFISHHSSLYSHKAWQPVATYDVMKMAYIRHICKIGSKIFTVLSYVTTDIILVDWNFISTIGRIRMPRYPVLSEATSRLFQHPEWVSLSDTRPLINIQRRKVGVSYTLRLSPPKKRNTYLSLKEMLTKTASSLKYYTADYLLI